MKSAVTVPIEAVDLRPSMKPRHEPRTYRHEELIDTPRDQDDPMGWTVLSFSLLPEFVQLT